MRLETTDYEEPCDAIDERPLGIGVDERRMQVRAYHHWVSLLHGRRFPDIADFDPEDAAGFGAHGVLLDFTRGPEEPRIRYLGSALREECGLAASIDRITQAPSLSLLSRLTDHYRQSIASRAPVGFEAEFVNARGHETLYRGILMPFSSDGETVDFLHGVVNWKELVGSETRMVLQAQLAAAIRPHQNPPPTVAPAWADGPGSGSSLPPTAGGNEDLVLLVARRNRAGGFEIVAEVERDPALLQHALRRTAGR